MSLRNGHRKVAGRKRPADHSPAETNPPDWLLWSAFVLSCVAFGLAVNAYVHVSSVPHPARSVAPPQTTLVVPEVDSPAFNVSGYASRPCATLDADTLAAIGLGSPGRESYAGGRAICEWTSTVGRVSSFVLSLNGEGWRDQHDERGPVPGLELADDIGGYPALHLRVSGSCTTLLGSGGGSTVAVIATNGPGATGDPCAYSDRVVGSIVERLKE